MVIYKTRKIYSFCDNHFLTRWNNHRANCYEIPNGIARTIVIKINPLLRFRKGL